MKLAYLLDHFPSISETFILREMMALRDRGFDITIFSMTHPQVRIVHPDALPFAPHTRYVHVTIRDCFRALRTPGGPLRLRPRALWLAREIQRRQLPHIHAHFAAAPAELARITASLTGCTYSVSAHAWDIFTRPARSLAWCLEPARFVSVCTQAGADHLCALFPGWPADKITQIPHGVFPDTFPESDLNGTMILAVGRLVRKKGFSYLVDACRMLKTQGYPVECVIAGGGPDRNILQEQIRQTGLQDNVCITGTMTQPEILTLYQRAALLVAPSIVLPDGDRDGLPNVVLEAMASGLPVVAFNTGGIAEAIRDNVNGILVPTGNTASLASAVRRLLDDPVLRQRLGSQGRADVRQRFDLTRNIVPLATRLEPLIRRDLPA